MKNIRIKAILFGIAMIALIMFIPNLSKAASLSIRASKSTANAGETISVTISSDSVGRVNLSVSNGTLSTNKVWLENNSQTVNVTVGGQGTTTITATPENGQMSNNKVDVPVAAQSVNIAINSGNNNNGNNGGGTTSKSNNANLGNLGITPNDFTGFRANKTSYSVTVPNNVSTINVYAKKGHSGQTISGTGNKTLNVGNNTFNVVVTAEDGVTKKTYTINVTREGGDNTQTVTNQSNNADLKNLGIRPNDFSGFKANKTEYSVEVPNEVENIEVYAVKGNDKQTITGTGNKTLTEGENTFNVVVTAEDGTTKKIYTINVRRKAKDETTEEKPTEENPEEDPLEEIFGLSELTVEGLNLNPEFKTDIYEYTLDLEEDKEKLDIITVSTEVNATIEVTGNEQLQNGENVITILVSNEAGDKTATYQITVNKKIKDENLMAEEQEKIKQEKQKKIIMLACSAVAVVIIGIVAIVIIIKKSRNASSEIPYSNLYDEEDNFDDGNYEDYTYGLKPKQEIQEDKLDSENLAEENTEYDDYEQEETRKNKHKKGKRFK